MLDRATSMQPRPYQRAACDALYNYWHEGGGNGLIVIPTGGGKSLIMATIIRELLDDFPAMRIGIVTHVKELIQQNLQEFITICPNANVGVYSAGLGRRDHNANIIFCGIQSVHKKAKQLGGFDLLLVDESHLIPRSNDTMYGRFISDLKDITPDMRIVGLTATPYRLDTGRLDKGEGKIFDDIVYEANVRDLINQGFLSPLISKATHLQLDIRGVARRGGDFIPGELEARVNIDEITQEAVQELVELGKDRQGWLAFCCGVKHSEAVRDAIRAHGISCEMVIGDTPSAERTRIIDDFKAGRIRCLTSCAVLTTGFNAPHVELLALMRPTLSTGLYVQMAGRAFRKAPGKENALILDYAGVVRRHGPIDMISVGSRNGPEERSAVQIETVRAKECPMCNSLLALNARKCEHCDYEWPVINEPVIERKADETTRVLSSEFKDTWLPVESTTYSRHEKRGDPDAPPTMRVSYLSGYKEYSEWVCVEHTGFAGNKAMKWWHDSRGDTSVYPTTVDEAVERANDGELAPVRAIQVKEEGKFMRIVARRF